MYKRQYKNLLKLHPALQELNAHKIGTLQPKIYWINHTIPIDERVPEVAKKYDDWKEYDPREQPKCSAYLEMPA